MSTPRNTTGKHVNVGTHNHHCKITEDLVLLIRELRQQGRTYDAISATLFLDHDLDYAPQSIGAVCRNERWSGIR